LTESWSNQSSGEAELALVLTDVGAHIAQPAFTVATRVRAEIESSVAPRRLPRVTLIVAAIVLVIAVVTASIAPARDAVARFLGIGTTTVEQVDTLPDAEPRGQLPGGGSVQRLSAQLHDGRWYVPKPALVGTPGAWDVSARAATIAWPEVILSQEIGGEAVTKLTPRTSNTEFVDIGDVSGLWVPGPHVREVGGHRYESDSALIWVDHGIEFRLEGDLPLARMIAIAGSLHRA
jgi:hypothetical protein